MCVQVLALQSKAIRAFGILISHEPAAWNVKRTNRVTAFDIGPSAKAPFEREWHKSPQGFLLQRKNLATQVKYDIMLIFERNIT